MDFPAFLSYLQTVSGINAAIGIIMSFLVDLWPAYNELDAKAKRLVFLGLCFGVAIASAVVMAILKYAPWDFNALFWPAVVSAFAAFTGGTFAHTRKL